MPDSSFGFGAPALWRLLAPAAPFGRKRPERHGASSCLPPIVADCDSTGRHQWQTRPGFLLGPGKRRRPGIRRQGSGKGSWAPPPPPLRRGRPIQLLNQGHDFVQEIRLQGSHDVGLDRSEIRRLGRLRRGREPEVVSPPEPEAVPWLAAACTSCSTDGNRRRILSCLPAASPFQPLFHFQHLVRATIWPPAVRKQWPSLGRPLGCAALSAGSWVFCRR